MIIIVIVFVLIGSVSDYVIRMAEHIISVKQADTLKLILEISTEGCHCQRVGGLIEFVLRDFHALKDLDLKEFKEGLAGLKAKSKMTSEPPRTTGRICDITKCLVEGYTYYRIKSRKVTSDRKVMYIHGGGFFAEAFKAHWDMCQRLVDATGCEIYFPIYPLVPESSSKESHEMLLMVYKELLNDTPPDKITFIGDSAGGTLCLSLSGISIIVSPQSCNPKQNGREIKETEIFVLPKTPVVSPPPSSSRPKPNNVIPSLSRLIRPNLLIWLTDHPQSVDLPRRSVVIPLKRRDPAGTVLLWSALAVSGRFVAPGERGSGRDNM